VTSALLAASINHPKSHYDLDQAWMVVLQDQEQLVQESVVIFNADFKRNQQMYNLML
jgi:hypothetical protein